MKNTRSVYCCFIRCFLAIVGLLSGFSLTAQHKMRGRNADTYIYPWSHYSYVQPRFDRTNYDNDGYLNAYALKAVHAVNNVWHLRLDASLAHTNMTDDGKSLSGFSDMSFHMMHATEIYKQFYLEYGAELIFPTATDKALGKGKWQAHPKVAGVCFLGPSGDAIGTVLLGIGYQFDYAGQSDRPHISSLHIAPNFDYWGENWYVGYYATWKYDTRNKIFDLPLDVEVGYSFLPKWTIALEYILPLVNTDKVGYKNEFAVKLQYMVP